MLIQQLVGFTVNPDFRFELFGRKYRVGASGLKALRLLEEAYLCFRDRQYGSWPFALRSIVRKIRNVEAKSTLCFVASNAENPTIRILAIWLRGHCGGTLGTRVLSQVCPHADDQTRKEAARALQRMSAWEALRQFSNDPNPRVARMATSKTPQPFATKFERFSASVSVVDVPLSSQRLTLDPRVKLDCHPRRPPKSAEFIRKILLRIRNLLSDKKSCRNAG